MNDTSRLSIIVSADLPVNTFDELMEKKLPVRLDRGAKGTLHNVVGAMLLAEYGYTYDDITKWGGAHTAVSANDRVGMFQDGTLNAYLTLGPGQQSHIQELVLNAKVKWLPVSDKVLKSVTAKTGQSIGVIPADFYGGAVGRDIPCITDSTVMLVRKNMPDADVYKITKAIVEGFEELHAVQPTWKTLVPEHMADNLALPLHPGAEKYSVMTSSSPLADPFPARCSTGQESLRSTKPTHIRTRLIGKRFRKHPATLPCPAAFRRAYHRKRTTSWSSISVSALRTKAS
ncbi:MAG: TAXI family TRAP transporter solute-binding subunit [Bilophila wadsworthia]